jgi:hypothetical protein
MIQYIELLIEPFTILTLMIITFYGFGWFLEKCADLLGIENDYD